MVCHMIQIEKNLQGCIALDNSELEKLEKKITN